jgi:hypothetical protein
VLSLDSSKARAKDLARELPAFLAQLEAAGQRSIVARHGGSRGGSWEARAHDLGITSVFQSGTSHPGSVYVSIELPLERRGG